jgi:hypothetical protein
VSQCEQEGERVVAELVPEADEGLPYSVKSGSKFFKNIFVLSVVVQQ